MEEKCRGASLSFFKRPDHTKRDDNALHYKDSLSWIAGIDIVVVTLLSVDIHFTLYSLQQGERLLESFQALYLDAKKDQLDTSMRSWIYSLFSTYQMKSLS